MADDKWITVNGTHVLIEEGETPKSAIKKIFSNESKSGSDLAKKMIKEAEPEPEEPKKESEPKEDEEKKFSNFEKPNPNQEKINELEKELETTTGLFAKARLKNEIEFLKSGFSTKEEWLADKEAKHQELVKKAEKEKEERLAKKKEQESQQENSYKMAHRPTETGITASQTELGNEDDVSIPEDFFTNLGKYVDLDDVSNKETADALKKVYGKPNAKIKIYRATVGDKINDGDWITLSPSYAKLHNESSLNGKGNILEQEVSVNDIQFAGDDIREWGYFPKGVN